MGSGVAAARSAARIARAVDAGPYASYTGFGALSWGFTISGPFQPARAGS